MAYTPPAGGAIVVELSDSSAYTPPASNAIVVDLATEEGATGLIGFVNVTGSLSLAGYGLSKTTVAQTMPSATLTLAGYLPSFHTTKDSSVNVTGAVSLAGYHPSDKSIQSSQITAYGQLSLATYQPTYFCGNTQTIAENATIVVEGNSAITHTRVSHATIPLATLTLAAQPFTQQVLQPLGVIGELALNPQASIVHRQRIRREIVSRYYTPDVTLDNAGEIVVTGYAIAGHKQRIRRGVSGKYGMMYSVAKAITGQYTGRTSKSVTASYNVQTLVVGATEAAYSLENTDRVLSTIEGCYRMPVASGIASLYSMTQNTAIRNAVFSSYSLVQPIPVRAAVSAAYELVQNFLVRAGVESGYSTLASTIIASSVESSYSYRAMVRKAVGASYSMTSPVAAGVSCYYDIDSIVRARNSVMGIYSASNSQVIAITTAPYIEYFGARIGLSEAELTISEGDYAWKASVVLTHVTDYAKLKQDQPFSVIIGSERYEFIVDSKEMDRSNPANHAMKLLGISPSAKMTTPRHVATSYLWDNYVQATAVAQELLPGVDWQVMDWGIPAYRLAVQDSTPIETVKVIAGAIGATLESNIDGTLYVRSLFPVSVPNYATTTPAHVFIEDTDILRVNESYVTVDVFNRLVITDISQDISDSLEWIPDYEEATTGIMRAFLYPWRSAVSLRHTGVPGIFIDAPNLGMESHEEVIEVFQGEGQTGYPIHHVEGIQYEASNVGSLVFDVDSRSFTVGGPSFNSVIRLVYWTRSLDYRVSLPTTRPTQFLLESEPL